MGLRLLLQLQLGVNMTKQEKLAYNKELGLLWMQIRAYKNATRKRNSTGTEWKDIQSKYQEFIGGNEEICQAIETAYPKLLEQIKELRYPNDIEKAISCLNAVVPTDA